MHKASASIHKRGSVLRSVPLRLRDTTVHGAVHGTMKGRAAGGGRKKFGVERADRFHLIEAADHELRLLGGYSG